MASVDMFPDPFVRDFVERFIGHDVPYPPPTHVTFPRIERKITMSDDPVRAAALKAAGKFRLYENQHTAKAEHAEAVLRGQAREKPGKTLQEQIEDTQQKAAVNRAMAEELEGALGVGPQPALIDVDSTSKPQL